MTFEQAMAFQAAFCDANDAPVTARVCRSIAGAFDRESETGRRAIEWRGDYIADAVPLRLVAPFHALHRSGRELALAPLFNGDIEDGTAAIRRAVMHHDAEIATWLDGPPQTNAIGRSALFMAALLTLAERFAYPLELLEIGSSAGLNLLIDRYRYELGDRRVGPALSEVVVAPVWHGASPPAADVSIASIAGCDVAPPDVRDPAQAERLLSYVWVDQHERLRQTAVAIDLLRADPPRLVQADGADFVEARFASPQPVHTTRVLMHSIVWQYLPDATKARVTAAVERAAAAATADRPVAWIAFETERPTGRQVLTRRSWPGDGHAVELATAHPHGAHVEWLG